MIKQDWMVIVAGEELVDAMTMEQKNQCRQTWGGHYDSEDVVEMQRSQSRRGIVGVEIIVSSTGCSVRYDSGLQNFGLLATSRELGGSLEAAERYAQEWVAEDPERRYAWYRKF